MASHLHADFPSVRVLDLCCGLGGLSVAARDMGMTVVAGVDVNPNAMRTFSKNFPEAAAIEGIVESLTVLERCRALLALIENVLTVPAEKHDDRMERFGQVLASGNCHVEKGVLDSSEYGVPQKPKRVFFLVKRQSLHCGRRPDHLKSKGIQ